MGQKNTSQVAQSYLVCFNTSWESQRMKLGRIINLSELPYLWWVCFFRHPWFYTFWVSGVTILAIAPVDLVWVQPRNESERKLLTFISASDAIPSLEATREWPSKVRIKQRPSTVAKILILLSFAETANRLPPLLNRIRGLVFSQRNKKTKPS